MGGTVYNSGSSRLREQEYKSMSREEIFKARELNPLVDPMNLTVREARDSDVHPNTVPIIIAFDVTGSMGRIPHELATKHFSKMMETLIGAGIVDATICFCGVGDHYSDEAPLQVGQFESGDIELDATLTAIWLEGGGGGQRMESYMLPWLFAARHTSTDAWEKREKKGFLFTIGDEWNHKRVESSHLKRILGYEGNEDTISELLLKEAQEKWEVFHIHCEDGSYGKEVSNLWKELLGERCVTTHSSKIVDTICTTVASLSGIDVSHVETLLENHDKNTNIPQFIK